jgi:excisionase family DNA binding protein
VEGRVRGRSAGSALHEGDRLLDVKEAGELLGLSPATLYGWAYRRRVPVVKPSGPRGPLRFRLSDLSRFVEQHTRPALRASA